MWSECKDYEKIMFYCLIHFFNFLTCHEKFKSFLVYRKLYVNRVPSHVLSKAAPFFNSLNFFQHYERVFVPGKHHVHLCNPTHVSDHVTSMLNRPIRTGLLK